MNLIHWRKRYPGLIRSGGRPCAFYKQVVLCMKLTTFFLTALCTQLWAGALAQSITLHKTDVALEHVLRDIRKQSNYQLFYNSDVISKANPVSIQVRSVSLSEALDRALLGQPLTYEIDEKTIIIKPKKVSLRESRTPEYAPPVVEQVTARGKVTDQNSQALEGVSILEKGTTNGTTTDGEGNFSLNILDESATLIFSYVGFERQEVSASSTFMAVVLTGSLAELDEVVVVGYGTQRKANLTGAVSAVTMDEVLGNRPVSSTAEALQGAIPGLRITSDSGRPGTGASVNVRGSTSINGGAPLVLVDNVPMAMNNVNPMDIESVTVLKDAAASSIYGARAAFGVILITTKKGNKNQPNRFEYSTNVTFSEANELPRKASPLQKVQALSDWGTSSYWTGQDTDTWLELLNEYQANPGAYPTGETTIGGVVYPLAQTHQYGDDFLTTGLEQLHNLSYSGGSERTTYRVSLGYTDEDGIMITDSDRYQRYNINAFLNTELTTGLTSTVNLFYRNQKSTSPSNIGDVYYLGTGIGSYAPLGWGTTPDGKELPYMSPGNILRMQKPINQFGDDLRVFGKLEYKPMADLTISGEYTFNKTTTNQRNIVEQNSYIHPSTRSELLLNNLSRYNRSTGNTDYHALNVYANYTKQLGNHHISGIIGMNHEMSSLENFNINRLDLINPEVPSISTSTGVISGGDSFSEFAVSGYFGRINYNYDDKYLFEANGRFDGSSRFPAGSRFGFFPSFSAGWNISQEPFMDTFKPVLTHLKLRGSWGEVGNQAIGNYQHIPGMSSAYSSWVDLSTNIRHLSLLAPSLVSAAFTWETVRTANIGIDLSLSRARFNASFDYFNRRTLNMLAPGMALPAILGTNAPLQNVADLESKGWELELSWKDQINTFRYSFGVNLWDDKAFITRYNNPAGLLQFNGDGTLSNYYEGQQIGEIWGFRTQGFYTVDDFVSGSLNDNLQRGTLLEGVAGFRGIPQNPGDIRYVDINGDGEIFTGNNTLEDSGDRTIIGNSNRRYQFGIFGTASYKNFDLSLFLQGVGKRDLFVNNAMYWPYIGQFETVYAHHLDYWTPANTSAFYPRSYPDAGGNTGSSRRIQTKYLSNAAYLRVRNVTLGYKVPEDVLRNVFIDNVRVFFSGENLFNFHHMPKGMDAEAAAQSRGQIYPFLRKYSVGVNISF